MAENARGNVRGDRDNGGRDSAWGDERREQQYGDNFARGPGPASRVGCGEGAGIAGSRSISSGWR